MAVLSGWTEGSGYGHTLNASDPTKPYRNDTGAGGVNGKRFVRFTAHESSAMVIDQAGGGLDGGSLQVKQ